MYMYKYYGCNFLFYIFLVPSILFVALSFYLLCYNIGNLIISIKTILRPPRPSTKHFWVHPPGTWYYIINISYGYYLLLKNN